MDVTFGSVGDIISVCVVVNNLIRALDDCRGSSAEYQEVIRELSALKDALQKVDAFSRSGASSVELKALCHSLNAATTQCRCIMESFFQKITKYKKYLREGGSGNLIKDSCFKAIWQVSQHADLARFRSEITAYTTTISILLGTANVALIQLNGKNLSSLLQHTEQKNDDAFTGLKNLLTNVYDQLRRTNETVAEEKNIINHATNMFRLSWKDMVRKVIAINVLTCRAVIMLQSYIDRPLNSQIWTLDDPIGRTCPVDVRFVNSWEAFYAVIETRFRTHPGHKKIQRKEFTFREASTGRDISRVQPWNNAFVAGERYEMSMVFVTVQGESHTNSCPRCHTPADDNCASETKCSCGMSYRRITEIHERNEGANSTQPGNSRVAAETTSKKASSEFTPLSNRLDALTIPSCLHHGRKRKFQCGKFPDIESESIKHFKRVRLVSRKFRTRALAKRRSILGQFALHQPFDSIEAYQLREEDARMKLTDLQAKLGPEHADTLSCLNDLASVYRNQRKFSMAEELLRRSVRSHESAFGPDDPRTLNAISSLAIVLVDQNKFRGAQAFQQKVVESYERMAGETSQEVQESRKLLVYLLRVSGSFAEAELVEAGVFSSSQGVFPKLKERMDAECGLSQNVDDQGSIPLSDERFTKFDLVQDVVMKDLDEELIEPGSEFENDNGHTYHSYRPGQYLLPIDDNARYYEELLHNAVLHTCGNRLHYSPASANLEHVLDIGTGAGLWAIAMGQEYPKAKIDGFDLSPIQPAFIPPNVDFYVGDFTEEDPLTDRGPQYGYDLIHGRHLTMAVRDWPKLLATVLQDLKPGGFLELQELHLLPHLRGGQISHDTGTIGHFTMLLTEAFGNFGIDLHAPTALESLMKDAGYVEVTVECRNMPLSSKPASLDLDDAGNTMWYWLYFGADGLSNKPLREGLGWVEEKRQALLNELRETLEKQSRNEQILFRYYVVYGRKACE